MRVRARFRDRRVEQGLSLRDVSARTGVAIGELSMIERGHQLPRDEEVAALARVYGDPAGWYPPTVVRALAPDLIVCAACGEELPTDARANRRYHDECRR